MRVRSAVSPERGTLKGSQTEGPHTRSPVSRDNMGKGDAVVRGLEGPHDLRASLYPPNPGALVAFYGASTAYVKRFILTCFSIIPFSVLWMAAHSCT